MASSASAAFVGSPLIAAAGSLLRWLDGTAQDLACRPLRQFVDEPDVPRVLVGGDPLLDKRTQFLWSRRAAWLQRHLLAERGVGYPDDRDLGDRRVLVERLLDLARVHVVPAADDHFLLPVDDEEVAVLVGPRQVSGAEPAVGNRLRGRLRPPPVALHHVV